MGVGLRIPNIGSGSLSGHSCRSSRKLFSPFTMGEINRLRDNMPVLASVCFSCLGPARYSWQCGKRLAPSRVPAHCSRIGIDEKIVVTLGPGFGSHPP